MQELIKKHSTSITVAIVSTIIFMYILQPLLEFIGSKAVSIGGFLGASYVDELFAQVSHLEIMDFSFFFYMLFSVFIAVFFTFLIISTWQTSKKDGDENKEKIETKTKSTLTKVRSTVIYILFIIFFITMVSTKFYQLSLISSFKQHLRIVAPYMSQQDEKKLLSEWSLIESKKDYDDVNKKMIQLATENNIELPDNKLYSLTSL